MIFLWPKIFFTGLILGSVVKRDTIWKEFACGALPLGDDLSCWPDWGLRTRGRDYTAAMLCGSPLLKIVYRHEIYSHNQNVLSLLSSMV